MASQAPAPYGSWQSPLTADSMASTATSLEAITIDGADVYWCETRPADGGRTVIVRRAPDGTVVDMTPAGYSARTRVHEYGGRPYAVWDGVLYFSNDADQRLYRQSGAAAPTPLTPPLALRFADFAMDFRRRRLVCVREDHSHPGGQPVNTLVAVPTEGQHGGDILAEGRDFYASPRLSPDGRQIAWLAWDLPNMPWDGTELWLADIAEDGSLHDSRRVAGGVSESICQPEWSPDAHLHFVSDRTGWWNLYTLGEAGALPLHQTQAEFGVPQWELGLSTYGFATGQQIVASYTKRGRWSLATMEAPGRAPGETPGEAPGGAFVPVSCPYTDLAEVVAAPGKALLVASSPHSPQCIAQLDLASGQYTELRRLSTATLDHGYLSRPEPIEFPTSGGATAFGFFYAPQNRDYTSPAGEHPPLLVMSHGGPTAAAGTGYYPKIQYWTSRGIAVLDVDYRGSTGYGREYREQLNGQWGVVDVDDCINGAEYLARTGRVDRSRLAITGGSAGGYTTLCALTFHAVFKAGASKYGIGDLEMLARDTHKFESRYLDRLIGPYPDRRDLYVERSPINFVDRLSCPVILFQGLDDAVVPPAQARMMFDAVRAKGLPVALLEFPGEGHGFRRQASMRRALEAELYFYSRIFGFEPADRLEPVHIENLD